MNNTNPLRELFLQSLKDKHIPKNDSDPLLNEKIKNSVQDRELRKKYASWFIGILIGQLLIMDLIFISVGRKCMYFENWALEMYITGTLIQTFGVVFVITKNLFPNHK